MTSIVEFTIRGSDFPLGSIFTGLPDVSVKLDRLVPTNTALLPFFWVWGRDIDDVEEVLADQAELRSVTVVDTVDGGGLFRVTWNEDEEGILTAIAGSDLQLTKGEGTGESGRWVFEFRAERTESIAAFQRHCDEHDLDVTLNRMFSLAASQTGGEYNLTAPQHEALVLAFTEGYYDDPRSTSLEELGDKLGISRPSVSSRLRRGHANLIGSTLLQTESGYRGL